MLQSIYIYIYTHGFFSGFQRPEVEKDVILSSAQSGACAPRRHGIVMVGKAIVGFGVPNFLGWRMVCFFWPEGLLQQISSHMGCGSNLEKLGPTHRGPFSNHMFDPHGSNLHHVKS